MMRTQRDPPVTGTTNAASHRPPPPSMRRFRTRCSTSSPASPRCGCRNAARLRPRLAVFGVGDVVAPRSRAVSNRDVGHEVLVGGAVPVLLAVGRQVNVARSKLDNVLAPRLHEPATFGDVQRLAALVRMPGGAGAGREVH